MTPEQETALRSLCERYHVAYRPQDYRPTFDLPSAWVAGWIGGQDVQATTPTIYVGCSPEGQCSS